MSPISLGMLPGSLALTRLRAPLSTMPVPLLSPKVNLLWPHFSPNSSPWLMTLGPLLPSSLGRLNPSPPPRESAQLPPHHHPHPTWSRPSRICPLVLLLSPHTTPLKWHLRCLKRHPLLPLLSKLSLLSRKRKWQPASWLTRSPPRIFPPFSRANGMTTQTCTLNATRIHLKPLSFLPHVITSRKNPSFTASDTQPPHSSIPAHPPVSQSLNPRSPKNKPEHRLLGRAVRARIALLPHKSLLQARVVSPKDPHRSPLHNVGSFPPAPPQPS